MGPARWAQVWDSQALLLRVARRQGADANDAEDAVQEAMVCAAEHPEIAEERLQAWLITVTIRLCMNEHRRRTGEIRRWQRAAARAVVQQPGQYLEDEICERSEALWLASLAAEILPPRQAQALRLIASGCDLQQVANHLGVRYRAAESLLARARRTVRTAVTASLGVLVCASRGHLPGVSNPIPMAFASATAATMMAVAAPTAAPSPQRPGELADRLPAASPLQVPAVDSAAFPDLESTGPTTPGAAVGPLTPQLPPQPADLPVLLAAEPPADGADGGLTPLSLPELPEVAPLLAPTEPLLGRSGPRIAPRLPALPTLRTSPEELLANVSLPALPLPPDPCAVVWLTPIQVVT